MTTAFSKISAISLVMVLFYFRFKFCVRRLLLLDSYIVTVCELLQLPEDIIALAYIWIKCQFYIRKKPIGRRGQCVQ